MVICQTKWIGPKRNDSMKEERTDISDTENVEEHVLLIGCVVVSMLTINQGTVLCRRLSSISNFGTILNTKAMF